ncbi:MAG: EthD domain-containing protein [Porticoccaceae bacterium]
MVKIIMLIKKRPDLSREEFIDYYDNVHVPLMHKILSKGAAIHRRNFVIPNVSDIGAADNLDSSAENEYDVICEVFYEDRETAESVMRDFEDPEIRRICEEDEARFQLPGSIKRYIVDVHETVFRPIPGVAG